MKKIIIFLAVVLMANTGLWAETQNVSYSYPVYNTEGDPASGIKEWKTASVDATVVKSSDSTVVWGAAGTETWYVVTQKLKHQSQAGGIIDDKIHNGIDIKGTVHLILCDTLTVVTKENRPGINTEGATLVIYRQPTGKGLLKVKGGDVSAGEINGSAGIGGSPKASGGTVIINGSDTVRAKSSFYGAGIGGGSSTAEEGSEYNYPVYGGTVTINGGTVTTQGDAYNVCIGGYRSDESSLTTITNGAIKFTGTFLNNLNDNNTIATRANISGGIFSYKPQPKWLQDGCIVIENEDVSTRNEFPWKVVDENDGPHSVSTIYIDEKGVSHNIDAKVVDNADKVTVAWGETGKETWYVVNGEDVTLSQGAVCQGDVNLILADGAKLTATGKGGKDYTPGIQVSGEGNSLTIYGQTYQTGELIALGGENAAGIGGSISQSGSNITINGGTVTATGGDEASGIGGGKNGTSNNILVATTFLVKADGNNPPTEEIEHDGGDIAEKLAGKQYAVITSILPFRDAAIAAVNAVLEGVTNENIKYFANSAITNIKAATTTNAINSIKEKALSDLQNAFAIYDAGKTEALGPLGEKQDGPAVEVIKGDKKVILYSPDKVNFIKEGE